MTVAKKIAVLTLACGLFFGFGTLQAQEPVDGDLTIDPVEEQLVEPGELLALRSWHTALVLLL